MIRSAIFIAVIFSLVNAGQANAETREQNAARLISQATNLKARASKLHGKAETSINNANRLKGEAHSLLLKVGTPEFKRAVAQYSGDLAQFRNHAQKYHAHLTNFQQTIGECHAGEAAYENSLKDYQLHVKLFHIPDLADIRPPHICGELEMSQEQSTRLANQIRQDQVRVVEAQKELNEEELKLRAAQSVEILNARKTINSAIRNKREQELAAEFGKLKEEYELLKIENQALGGPKSKAVADIGASTSSTSVHAKISDKRP